MTSMRVYLSPVSGPDPRAGDGGGRPADRASAPRNQITTRALPQYLDYRGRLLAQLFADEGLVATEPA
jgi:hypothetical protein